MQPYCFDPHNYIFIRIWYVVVFSLSPHQHINVPQRNTATSALADRRTMPQTYLLNNHCNTIDTSLWAYEFQSFTAKHTHTLNRCMIIGTALDDHRTYSTTVESKVDANKWYWSRYCIYRYETCFIDDDEINNDEYENDDRHDVEGEQNDDNWSTLST